MPALALLAIGALIAAGCGGDDGGDGSGSGNGNASQGATQAPADQGSTGQGRDGSERKGGAGGGETAARGGTREQVAMREYEFAPKKLVVKYGATLTVTNDGEIAHNLTVERGPNPRIRTEKLAETSTFMPGRSEPLQIRLPPGRTYAMVCTVPGHRELGMVGTMRVKP